MGNHTQFACLNNFVISQGDERSAVCLIVKRILKIRLLMQHNRVLFMEAGCYVSADEKSLCNRCGDDRNRS